MHGKQRGWMLIIPRIYSVIYYYTYVVKATTPFKSCASAYSTFLSWPMGCIDRVRQFKASKHPQREAHRLGDVHVARPNPAFSKGLLYEPGIYIYFTSC